MSKVGVSDRRGGEIIDGDFGWCMDVKRCQTHMMINV